MKTTTTINFNNVTASALAFSVVLITPVFATILISHVLMAAIILIWSLKNAPNSLILLLGFAILALLYIGAISYFFGLGERYIVESTKVSILILFVAAVKQNPEFTRASLLYLSIIIAVSLTAYTILSADPFVYGGRLGIIVDENNARSMISANTIGLAINIALATIIGGRHRVLYLAIPVLLILLFFTYSRGALTCFALIVAVYLFRNKNIFAAFIISIFSVVIFSDVFSELFYTLRFDDLTGSGRIDLYQFMYERVIAQPLSVLTGFGPGAIYFEISTGVALVSAHSGYLEMIYTFGMFGLVAMLVFVYNIIKNFNKLSLDTLLYAVLILAYAISEDLLGSHALFAFGLMFAVILHDFAQMRANVKRKVRRYADFETPQPISVRHQAQRMRQL